MDSFSTGFIEKYLGGMIPAKPSILMELWRFFYPENLIGLVALPFRKFA